MSSEIKKGYWITLEWEIGQREFSAWGELEISYYKRKGALINQTVYCILWESLCYSSYIYLQQL